jgi:hypothetical protein
MKKNFYLLLSTTVLLLSCSKETELTEVSNQQQIDSSDKIENSYNLLDNTPNVYHDYFKDSDEIYGYSALMNPLDEYSIVEIGSETEDSSSVLFNKQQLVLNKKVENSNQNIYGKTLNISIANKNAGAKGLSVNTEVSFYVPKLIYITNPSVTNEDEIFPTCYSEDFVLEWNADINNKEGLVVIAEYLGDDLADSNKNHITNVDYIKNDNGKVKLSSKLFKDIPNLSPVHIILLRGNVKIEEVDGKVYKFFAESHMRLPIMLVKDLTTIISE